MHFSLRCCVFLLLLLPASARGQWAIVSRGLFKSAIQTPLIEGGSLTFRDGMLWGGFSSLFSSSDSGVTWTTVSSLKIGNDFITGIAFHDRDTGAVITAGGIVWRTQDGGKTWVDILEPQEGASIAFGATGKTIVASLLAPGVAQTSTDGGNTWQPQQQLNVVGRQVLSRDGVFWFITAAPSDIGVSTGLLFSSTDNGKNWQTNNQSFDGDSYSFAIDSCGITTYVVNEGTADSFDPNANIFASSGGGTFNSVFQKIKPTGTTSYLTGAIALGKRAAYVLTAANGVIRSLDRGATWQNIGGPTTAFNDAEYLCTIDDNIILAVDASGSIWRTVNSGGSPVAAFNGSPLQLSATNLFTKDTLAICNSVSQSVVVTPEITGCLQPTIISQSLTGADKANYQILHSLPTMFGKPDSIVIQFSPDTERAYSASLDFALSNGKTYSIPLGGRGHIPQLKVSSTAIVSDTIGGDIWLPITLTGDYLLEFGLQLSYDSSILIYKGTADRSGRSIDNPLSSPGNASIAIPKRDSIIKDSTIAFAHFLLFPTSINCSDVSLTITGIPMNVTACINVSSNTVTVCGTGQCAQTEFSHLLRTGTWPHFALAANPVQSSVSIISDQHNGTAAVWMIGLTGSIEMQSRVSLSNQASEMDVSGLAIGPHWIRIEVDGYVQSLRVLIER